MKPNRPAMVRDGERTEVPLTVAQHQMIVNAVQAVGQAVSQRDTIVNTLSAGHTDGPMEWSTEAKGEAFVLLLKKPEVPKT